MQHAYAQDRRTGMQPVAAQAHGPAAYEPQQAAHHWVMYIVFAAVALAITIISSQPGIENAVWKMFR